MLNTMMENEHTSFGLNMANAVNMISEKDQNIRKTCVFIFHHSIQNDEASGYTFHNLEHS